MKSIDGPYMICLWIPYANIPNPNQAMQLEHEARAARLVQLRANIDAGEPERLRWRAEAFECEVHVTPISPLYLPYISPIIPLRVRGAAADPTPTPNPNPNPSPNPHPNPNTNRNPSPNPKPNPNPHPNQVRLRLLPQALLLLLGYATLGTPLPLRARRRLLRRWWSCASRLQFALPVGVRVRVRVRVRP